MFSLLIETSRLFASDGMDADAITRDHGTSHLPAHAQNL
jgi:hypothetical protein